MDDLLDLDWKAPGCNNNNKATVAPSYRFDSLTRPINSSSPATLVKSVAAKTSSGDAFSSLLSFGGSSAQNENLTMAERQRRAQQQAREYAEKQNKQHQATWGGLEDDWGAPKKTFTPPPVTAKAADTWDFDAFSSAVPVKTASSKKPSDPFDFDSFDDPPTKLTPSFTAAQEDEENILGALAKPIEGRRPTQPLQNHNLRSAKSSTASSSPYSSRVPSPASGSRPVKRPTSPPPHIIGQIVEMGFSPQDARKALSKTDGGLNIQAALEFLVAGGHQEDEDACLAYQLELQEHSLGDDDIAAYEAKEADRPRRQGPTRDPALERTSTPNADWQQQAYAQVSEIGASVLSKAGAFWSSAKAQAQKALEERQKATAGGENKAPGGKPKWLIEAEAATAKKEAEEQTVATAGGGFKDSDDEEEQVAVPATKKQTAPEVPKRSANKIVANLWDDPAPAPSSDTLQPPSPAAKKPYVSPNRHGPNPSPKKVHQRTLPLTDPSILSSAQTHKVSGNASFRSGAYSDAESHYTLGISLLPSSSLHLVPLWNNRASTRLKNGDATSAIADCDSVLSLILQGDSEIYRPSTEGTVPLGLNLRDAFGKALLRRAQALEASEKWLPAKKDWETLLRYEKEEGSGKYGTGNMRFAKDGVSRCAKMLGQHSAPVPTPRRQTAIPVVKGEALQAHQANTQKAEAEDAGRLALKDSVDNTISTWKAGKENNLRALIASVDTFAWEGLGWNKVGMHQLVTDAQVKKAYVRAIARLHPDKLKVETTLEQRMLAAGAFNALNEAWNK